jgi:hypothetical protein
LGGRVIDEDETYVVEGIWCDDGWVRADEALGPVEVTCGAAVAVEGACFMALDWGEVRRSVEGKLACEEGDGGHEGGVEDFLRGLDYGKGLFKSPTRRRYRLSITSFALIRNVSSRGLVSWYYWRGSEAWDR